MRGRSLALVLSPVLLLACATVLGVDKDYVEVTSDGGMAEAGVGDSAGNGDAGAADANESDSEGGCRGHLCDGVCLPGSDCSGCATAMLFCAKTHECVSACTRCSSASLECWSCSGTARSGSCEPAATAYCLGGAYATCACDAGGCPGTEHLCLAGACVNCGARGADTDGRACANGMTCESEKQRCHD